MLSSRIITLLSLVIFIDRTYTFNILNSNNNNKVLQINKFNKKIGSIITSAIIASTSIPYENNNVYFPTIDVTI